MRAQYDTSWDPKESEDGNLPDSEEAFNRIFAVWETRAWLPWLKEHLKFPFMVERMEDEDDAYFTDIASHAPFRLGHTMQAVEISPEDGYGLVLKVEEVGCVGRVPLCDVEVTSRKDESFWPVREYVVWFANR